LDEKILNTRSLAAHDVLDDADVADDASGHPRLLADLAEGRGFRSLARLHRSLRQHPPIAPPPRADDEDQCLRPLASDDDATGLRDPGASGEERAREAKDLFPERHERLTGVSIGGRRRVWPFPGPRATFVVGWNCPPSRSETFPCVTLLLPPSPSSVAASR